MNNPSASDSRARTPSRSPVPPVSTAIPPVPSNENNPTQDTPLTPRRSSFSFLRRGKSVERLNSKRSTSGNKKLTKRQLKELENQAQQNPVPMEAPKIPNLASPPQLQTFGGENVRPDSFAIVAGKANGQQYKQQKAGAYGVPIPPMPGNQAYVDPYARTESMTNRGRYSYASSAVSSVNNPRRVRRRKDPTPFNVLVVGARNSGKTSFVDFLKASLTLPARKQRGNRDDNAPESGPSKFNESFISQYIEAELEDGERIGVTLWDSEGLEQNILDLQLRQISSFIESKFEETFDEETKIMRSPGARDTHIHCVFLVLDPLRLEKIIGPGQSSLGTNGNVNGQSFITPPSPQTGTGLKDDDLSLQVLRALQGKSTVIPVISKADTITVDHMDILKRSVWSTLKASGLDHLEALGLDGGAEDEDSEDDSSDDSDVAVASAGRPRHNSKKFDERDEDNRLRPDAAYDPGDRSTNSRLDLSSSESSSAVTNLKGGSKSLNSTPYLPLSILSPSPIIAHEPGIGRTGRRFPWGFADPYDPSHCDFVKLKESVFGEWRSELREASREVWYEQWRTSRLHKVSPGRSVRSNQNLAAAGQKNQVPPRAASANALYGNQNQYQKQAPKTGATTSATVSGPMGSAMPGSQGASWPLPSR